jgi:hypothetical protein
MAFEYFLFSRKEAFLVAVPAHHIGRVVRPQVLIHNPVAPRAARSSVRHGQLTRAWRTQATVLAVEDVPGSATSAAG